MLVRHDVPLAPRTTLGVGGPAKRLVRVETVGELREALDLDAHILILGGGSNLVVPDAGWDGLVIELALPGVEIRMHDDHAVVSAFAGVGWDDFVAQMVEAGLVGVECLSGIPGLVGATPMQNVGAYGQEVADTIVFVRALDRTTGDLVQIDNADCGFAYRTSKFRGSDRWIVVEVCFRLPRGSVGAPIRYAELSRALGGDRVPLAEVRRTVIELRRGKGMVVDPADPESRSAGSFFTNPIVDAATRARLPADVPSWPQPDGTTKLAAAWLIERAGFAKGYTLGRAGISNKHALALVNRGGATATELLALAERIAAGVRDAFGVELSPEPVIAR